MAFSEVAKNVLSVQYDMAKDAHCFHTILQNLYINNGNAIFPINTKTYCTFWPQVVKGSTRWCAINNFNFGLFTTTNTF